MARKRKAKRAQLPKPSWWELLPANTQHGVCVAALLILALVFYGPALFSGKDLVGGDTRQWRATAESMLDYRQTTGEEPLWANNVFAGMPGFVISPPPKVPQVDIVPNWVRRIAWPASHFVLLLIGAYALIWFLCRDKLSALLTACAFGLTTYLPVILVAGHNTKFISLCYAPWLLLAFVYTLRRPGMLAGLLFAVACSIQLRAGHIQITYYVVMVAGIWWATEAVGALRAGRMRPFAMSTCALVLGAAAALLMVAEIYLPAWEYKAYSIRGMTAGGAPGGLDWSYAMSWSQGPAELLTLLVADAFGGASLYWGPKPFTGGPHYVGAIVLLFAAVALWRVRTLPVRALGVAAGLMILFSLGRHLELVNRPMFDYFPLFDSFRVPETWLIAVALTVAILAGFGLAHVVSPEPDIQARKKKWKAILGITGVLVVLVVGLLAGKQALFSFERSGEAAQVREYVAGQMQRPVNDPQVVRTADQLIQEQLVPPRAEAFSKDAARTLVVLLLAGLLIALYSRRKMPAWVMQGLMLLLVVIDLGGVGRRHFNEDRLSPAGPREARVATYDVDRFLLQERDRAGGSGQFRVLSLEQEDQTHNGRPSFHHESLGGYSGAKLRLYQDFLDNMLWDPATGLPAQNALDMLNTRFVIADSPLPGLTEVFRGEQTGLLVLENPRVLPRAYLVGQAEVILDAPEAWSRLRSSSFDPHTAVVLTAPPESEIAPLDSASTSSVMMSRYGPREMSWEVGTDAPRLLVISEVFYPAGWKAWIDGVETSILRANYLLRGVHVPAGDHTVTLRFDPYSYRFGRVLSVATTSIVYLLLLALAGVVWFRNRTRTG